MDRFSRSKSGCHRKGTLLPPNGDATDPTGPQDTVAAPPGQVASPNGVISPLFFHKEEIFGWDHLLLHLWHHLKAQAGPAPASPGLVGGTRAPRSLLDRSILGILTESQRNLTQIPKKQQVNTRKFLKLIHFTNGWCSKLVANFN